MLSNSNYCERRVNALLNAEESYTRWLHFCYLFNSFIFTFAAAAAAPPLASPASVWSWAHTQPTAQHHFRQMEKERKEKTRQEEKTERERIENRIKDSWPLHLEKKFKNNVNFFLFFIKIILLLPDDLGVSTSNVINTVVMVTVTSFIIYWNE